MPNTEQAENEEQRDTNAEPTEPQLQEKPPPKTKTKFPQLEALGVYLHQNSRVGHLVNVPQGNLRLASPPIREAFGKNTLAPLEEARKQSETIKSIDFIISGDHGKGAFRTSLLMNVKFQSGNRATFVADTESPPKHPYAILPRWFVAGDLAFYAMVLGKENSSDKWCHLCDLHAKEWVDENHTPGTPWTVALLMNLPLGMK